MTKLLQTFIDGLSVGSLYALIALGYTMVYGVLQFINFAHGDVVMVGAWLSFLIVAMFGWTNLDPSVAPLAGALVMVAAMLACGTIGVIIERLAYRPLRNAPRLNILITAIGVSLFIQNVGQLRFIFGTEPQAMPQLLPEVTLFTLFGVKIVLRHVVVLALTWGLMVALDRLIHRSKMGLAMRAASHDVQTASLMGVPVDRVISITFFIGSSLAAVGGLLFAVTYQTIQQPADLSWILLGLKAFVAAVVGGIGNVRGAMVGGLLIGLLEQFARSYQKPEFGDVYVFALLIVVLLVKPTGILGKPMLQKV